jgi:hypothetical protein
VTALLLVAGMVVGVLLVLIAHRMRHLPEPPARWEPPAHVLLHPIDDDPGTADIWGRGA